MNKGTEFPTIHHIPYENRGTDFYIPVVADARLIYLANERLIHRMVAERQPMDEIVRAIIRHPLPRQYSLINFLLFAVTSRCNLRCRYCARQYNHGEISLSAGVQVLDEATSEMAGFDFGGEPYPFHLPYTSFTGGEPLLHPHIVELVAHASGKGLRPNVLTNGDYLTRSMAEKLLDARVGGIQISIDSSDPAVQKELTGEDIELKWHNIRELQAAMHARKRFPELLINIVMTKDNIAHLDETVRDVLHHLDAYIQRVKGRYINFIPVLLKPDLIPSQAPIEDLKQRVMPRIYDHFASKTGRVPFYVKFALENYANLFADDQKEPSSLAEELFGRVNKTPPKYCLLRPFSLSLAPLNGVYRAAPCSFVTFYEQNAPQTPKGAPIQENASIIGQMRGYYGNDLLKFTPFDPKICQDCPSETRRVNTTILFQLTEMIRFVQESRDKT